MHRTPINRPFSFRLPMSAEERDVFEAVVADSGMSAAAFIREMLKREYAKLAPKAAKKGKR
jgi:hypothetical protein